MMVSAATVASAVAVGANPTSFCCASSPGCRGLAASALTLAAEDCCTEESIRAPRFMVLGVATGFGDGRKHAPRAGPAAVHRSRWQTLIQCAVWPCGHYHSSGITHRFPHSLSQRQMEGPRWRHPHDYCNRIGPLCSNCCNQYLGGWGFHRANSSGNPIRVAALWPRVEVMHPSDCLSRAQAVESKAFICSNCATALLPWASLTLLRCVLR